MVNMKSIPATFISFGFIISLFLMALKYPQVSMLGISIYTLAFLILISNLSIQKTVMMSFKVGLLILSLGYGAGSLSGSESLVFLLFQRFFTLPSWVFVLTTVVFIFPGYSKLQEQAYSLYKNVFGRKYKFTVILISIVVLAQVLDVGSQLVDQGIWTVRHQQTKRPERYVIKKFGVGEAGWFYEVGEFWGGELSDKKRSVVAIPPQGEPWIQSGNPYYVLFFVYPAKIQPMPKTFTLIPSNITHLVVTRGETDNGDFGWPKVRIAKEKIKTLVWFNPFTGERKEKRGVDYDPKEFEGVYGLIELRK